MKARLVIDEISGGVGRKLARAGWLFGLVLAATAMAQTGPLITEFKAVNNGPLTNDFQEFTDWIELHNPTAQDVNLDGWFLTDTRANLRLWSFPATNLPAGGFMIVHASFRNQRVPGRVLHTNFRLAGGGEYLALIRPDGTTVAQEFNPFPPQTSQFSYGYHTVDSQWQLDRTVYLRESPGQPNPGPGAPAPLALTELMYHPTSPPPGGFLDEEDFEFIELRNNGPTVLNLSGATLLGDVTFTFGAVLLDPGARVVVANNSSAFVSRYGATPPVAGTFGGNLANSLGRFTLLDPNAAVVFEFTYSDQWARMTDGLGFSLVPVDENAPPSDYNQSGAWRASGRINGSPGQADMPSTVPRVFINEVLTRGEDPYEDAIELFNPGTNDVDISGWFLTDDFGEPQKYRMPRGATVPAGSFLALDEHAFNAANDDPTTTGFGLSDFGEEVYLVSADGMGALTGWAHGFRFGTAEPNVTYGRHIISTGDEHFVPQTKITFFASNSAPKIGPIVISEIHYHPPDLPGGDNRQHEFIKLHNLTGEPVSLFDPMAPTNTWRLRDAEQGFFNFIFPTNAFLGAHDFVIVMSFDPNNALNAAALQDFTSRLGVVPGTPLYGPWTNSLPNASATLELIRPDAPQPFFVPYIVMDRVRYRDAAPWPETANRTGASIHRINNAGYGDEPTNWWAAAPAPGRLGDGPPTFNPQPPDVAVPYRGTATFNAFAVGTPPIAYQWRFNGTNIPGATQPILTVANVLPAHTGAYSCFASNVAHAALSRAATLTIVDTNPPTVTVGAAPSSRVAATGLSLGGTASDDAFVTGVVVRLNGASPIPATGSNSWSLHLNLNPGFNTITTYAVDWRGNQSALVTNTVLFDARPARLGLLITDGGTVVGATHGQRLAIGRSYTLRAVPKPTHYFSHWLNWNTGQTTTNPAVTFTMEEFQTFSAVFAPGAYVALAGTYNGLFYDTNAPAHASAGFVNITLTSRGVFSGYLGLHGVRRPFAGTLDGNFRGSDYVPLSPRNGFILSFDFAGGPAAVIGTVDDGQLQVPIYAHLRGLATNSPIAQFAGRYAASLTATADSPPARRRNATIILKPDGLLTFNGRLPDGTPVAREVFAREDGLVPFYVAPYASGRGSAFGWLSLTNAGTNSLHGALLWSRAAPAGFTNGIELRGYR